VAIIEVASEVIKTQSKKQWSEWWDEDCQLAVQRKNEARKSGYSTELEKATNGVIRKRNEANRICAIKEKE
jgi:hypothetical protein